MNKEELKEKATAELQALFSSNARGYDAFENTNMQIRDLIDQLDEPEKVVVPEFVAEWIGEYKNQGYSLSNAIFNISRGDEDLDIEGYFREKLRTFIDAWDNGYTVEEKKYEVKDKNDCFLLTKNSEGEVINAYSKVVYKNKGQLTEQEIKDYDERFWTFAVPVKELEE